jgi:hypothetical protein
VFCRTNQLYSISVSSCFDRQKLVKSV